MYMTRRYLRLIEPPRTGADDWAAPTRERRVQRSNAQREADMVQSCSGINIDHINPDANLKLYRP